MTVGNVCLSCDTRVAEEGVGGRLEQPTEGLLEETEPRRSDRLAGDPPEIRLSLIGADGDAGTSRSRHSSFKWCVINRSQQANASSLSDISVRRRRRDRPTRQPEAKAGCGTSWLLAIGRLNQDKMCKNRADVEES